VKDNEVNCTPLLSLSKYTFDLLQYGRGGRGALLQSNGRGGGLAPK